MAAATLLVSCNASILGATDINQSKLSKFVSADALQRAATASVEDTGKRFLRSHTLNDNDDSDDLFAEDEERGAFSPAKLDDALENLNTRNQIFKKWRKKYNLTPAQVAEKLGIDLNGFGGMSHKYANLYLQYNQRYQEKLARHRPGTSRQ